jgi:hypothetical protein
MANLFMSRGRRVWWRPPLILIDAYVQIHSSHPLFDCGYVSYTSIWLVT